MADYKGQQFVNSFRLSSEAEWEYAAKGGQKSKKFTFAGSNNITDVAWYSKNSNRKTYKVGSKRPNELGLYDMSGNVYEWCSDWYGSRYYANSPSNNPKGPSHNPKDEIGDSYRVKRGGSWDNHDDSCQVSYRAYSWEDGRAHDNGFRLVTY